MKIFLPNWPLKSIDELTFKKILWNWLKTLLKKDINSLKIIENKDNLYL